MRSAGLRVSGTPIGKATTWAYLNGKGQGVFEIPTCQMRVTGTNRSGTGVTKDFEVFRFGVSCKGGKTATAVGLVDHQTHALKESVPTYSVHAATSPEDGGWQVYGNLGPRGFATFNDLVIALSGATGRNRDEQLRQIARARKPSIPYDRAARPPLVPLP